jgi:hypothetical protein
MCTDSHQPLHVLSRTRSRSLRGGMTCTQVGPRVQPSGWQHRGDGRRGGGWGRQEEEEIKSDHQVKGRGAQGPHLDSPTRGECDRTRSCAHTACNRSIHTNTLARMLALYSRSACTHTYLIQTRNARILSSPNSFHFRTQRNSCSHSLHSLTRLTRPLTRPSYLALINRWPPRQCFTEALSRRRH